MKKKMPRKKWNADNDENTNHSCQGAKIFNSRPLTLTEPTVLTLLSNENKKGGKFYSNFLLCTHSNGGTKDTICETA